jgi:hypothetical protein
LAWTVKSQTGGSLWAELLGATAADGVTAIAIIFAMSFGLILPKIAIDRWAMARERNSLSRDRRSRRLVR